MLYCEHIFLIGTDIFQGAAFGEVAILKNAPRGATIVVESEVAHFLTLTRREWLSLLRLDHRRYQFDLSFQNHEKFVKIILIHA